jgi:hypothetical protein
MKNRHALVDSKTGLVRNIIIWEGKQWLPPKDHYVLHDVEGQIGDYWHQEDKCFYTPEFKRRRLDEQGKVYQEELTTLEKNHIEPRLTQIYDHAKHVLKVDFRPDLTLADNEVPQIEQAKE